MLYEDNEQIKKIIRSIMAENKITYRGLAEEVGTSQQNLYKILNKPQLKLDDVKRICGGLGYDFHFDIKPVSERNKAEGHVVKLSKEVEEFINQAIIERMLE